MEHLQHDPRTKKQIKDAIYAQLYTPAVTKLQARLQTIIMRNTLLAGNSHHSFVYKGEYYSCEKGRPRGWNKLIPQLKPQMDEFLVDESALIDKELPLVMGYITKVLNASNDLGDYLQLFPESIHRPIQELAASCPCVQQHLTAEQVKQFKQENNHLSDLMKHRMVLNLIT